MYFSGIGNDSSVGTCNKFELGVQVMTVSEISRDRPKSLSWLHHHTMLILVVGLKKTRLILLEDYLVLLLVPSGLSRIKVDVLRS